MANIISIFHICIKSLSHLPNRFMAERRAEIWNLWASTHGFRHYATTSRVVRPHLASPKMGHLSVQDSSYELWKEHRLGNTAVLHDPCLVVLDPLLKLPGYCQKRWNFVLFFFFFFFFKVYRYSWMIRRMQYGLHSVGGKVICFISFFFWNKIISNGKWKSCLWMLRLYRTLKGGELKQRNDTYNKGINSVE